MMKEYRVLTYTSCNEKNEQQLEIQHVRTIWRVVCGLPPLIEVFVGNSTIWYNKLTHKRLSSGKTLDVLGLIHAIKYSQ